MPRGRGAPRRSRGQWAGRGWTATGPGSNLVATIDGVHSIKQEQLWTVRLILDGFLRSSRVLAGELRRVSHDGGRDDRGCRELAETIWSETLRAYLDSPVKSFAISGYPDVNPGYTHLLAALDRAGVPSHSEEFRLIAAQVSNEICRTTGRLLLVTTASAEVDLDAAMRSAETCYRAAFDLDADPQDPCQVEQGEEQACSS
jgi:hypothetical protein